MSFVVELLSRAQRWFASRRGGFRVVSLVLAGVLLFFTISLASPDVRSAYWGIAQHRVVHPVQRFVKARGEAKQRALAEREATKKEAARDAARRTGSLSSPYVEVGADEEFPLLVRVWVNIAPTHTARVSNNDERFPLVYERAVSAQGFVPIVGLTFGDNSFDIEIRDANDNKVAQHSLRATIEDKKNAQDRIEVRKKAAHNDFVSVALEFSAGPKTSPDKDGSRYYGVLDDLGDFRWLYLREAKATRGVYRIFRGILFDRKIFMIHEFQKILAMDIFGNKKVIFDGKNAFPNRFGYRIHHAYSFTDKGTMLLLADPLGKEGDRLSEEDMIAEVDVNSGKTIREIDIKESLSEIFDTKAGSKTEDFALLHKGKRDWMHLNSVFYDADSDTIILSGRNQSAVFALDYKTSALAWMFADPKGLTKSQQARFLKAPEGYVFHKGQHDAKLEGNRLRFFDNAVLIKRQDGSYTDPEKTPSRIVEATLDLANKKITKIKTYAPKNIFSKITGGYDFRDGKYLVCYCGIIKDVFGNYATDFRNFKNSKRTVEMFEFNEGSDRELLHVFIKEGGSFRPRYFDWKEMVEAN